MILAERSTVWTISRPWRDHERTSCAVRWRSTYRPTTVSDPTKTLSATVSRWYRKRPRRTSSSSCITTSKRCDFESLYASFPHLIPYSYFFVSFRQGFDSHVLRFRAKMISEIPENEERLFIVRVFLMDDTISIFELAKRNSGIRRSFLRIIRQPDVIRDACRKEKLNW